MPELPLPRGPISSALFSAMIEPPPPPEEDAFRTLPVPRPLDPCADDDLQLSLYCAYELHYRGFDGVDERWEWAPSLLQLRARLEAVFEAGLHEAVPDEDADVPSADEIDRALRAIADADASSLARFMHHQADLEHYRELLVHRSAYQLKEADPQTWLIPRLAGGPKAALVEIQADEYGGGRAERMHARLFADAMEALGLDSNYGAYLNQQPATSLAVVNTMSLFGLHRRLRGAAVGHLALFEATSSIPNGHYAAGLRRLGRDDERAIRFFDEHVEADAVHEQIATVNLAAGLVRQEPALAADVLFGARCLAAVEGRWARDLLTTWASGRRGSSDAAPESLAA